MVVKLHAVFWVMMPYKLIMGTIILEISAVYIFTSLPPEDRGRGFLQYFCNHLQDCKVQPRRPQYEKSEHIPSHYK
jgi:hypothetical protein